MDMFVAFVQRSLAKHCIYDIVTVDGHMINALITALSYKRGMLIGQSCGLICAMLSKCFPNDVAPWKPKDDSAQARLRHVDMSLDLVLHLFKCRYGYFWACRRKPLCRNLSLFFVL